MRKSITFFSLFFFPSFFPLFGSFPGCLTMEIMYSIFFKGNSFLTWFLLLTSDERCHLLPVICHEALCGDTAGCFDWKDALFSFNCPPVVCLSVCFRNLLSILMHYGQWTQKSLSWGSVSAPLLARHLSMNTRENKGFVRRGGKCSAEECITRGLQLVKI